MKNCLSKQLVLNRYGEHFNVHVFKSTGMLNGWLAKQKWFQGDPRGKQDRVLATTHFRSHGKSKRLGDIYFSLENISIDTIAHESTHFAAGLMILKGRTTLNFERSGPRKDSEEWYAIFIGQVAQRIADYLYSLI